MFGYRAYVFQRYLDCMNEALTLRQQLVGEQGTDALATLREGAASLRARVEALKICLPDDVLDELKAQPRQIEGDLAWLDDGLRRPNLNTARGAVIDIVERRGPQIWRSFDDWCDANTRQDAEFHQRVERLLNIGQADSAVRKAWAVFKSRVTRQFDLPSDIDGEKLATRLFGGEGATKPLLPGPEREGYLRLVQGLYALHRNEIVHNDISADLGATEALLVLLSGILVRLQPLSPASATADPLNSGGQVTRARRASRT